MARVLVGRPRLGPRVRIKRLKRHQGQEREPENTLLREPMSRGRGTKCLNENLAPLERYLRRQLGRPWDKVYSEISERLRCTSAVQQHVRDHLEDFVTVRTWREGGELWGQRPWGLQINLSQPGYDSCFYVDPRTGLLRERKRRPRTPWRTQEPDPELRWDGPWRQLRWIDSLWYAFQLAAVPSAASEWSGSRDRLLGRSLEDLLGSPEGNAALLEAYERDGVFASQKRQLSKRELKRVQTLPCGRKKVER